MRKDVLLGASNQKVKGVTSLGSLKLFVGDSLLLFWEDNENQFKYYKWIVKCFKLVLSMKINLKKEPKLF